jgi:hypothetical protein
MKTRKFAIGIVVLLLVLISAIGVAAYSPIPDDCLDSVEIAGFTVCFAGQDDNNDGTTTWTYAVQSDAKNSTPALSHFTLELCPTFYPYVEPGHEDTYTTPGSYQTITGREGIQYIVEIGTDPTTGVGGIKFEDGEPPLGEDGAVEIDIFQFDLPTQNVAVGEINVGVKAAGSYTGTIDGPTFQESAEASENDALLIKSCTEPTAVRLVNLRVSHLSFFDRLLNFFGLFRQ